MSSRLPARDAASLLVGILLTAGFAATLRAETAILGTRPSYGPDEPAAVANSEAIGTRIWQPGLDAGYNPQGLTVIGGSIFVAAYRSDAFSVHRGPCRVFRLDPASGAETGHVDVPAPCGHAGGLADAGNGRLYLADTHTLFAIDLASAFAGGTPLFRQWPLGAGVEGAVAASDRDAIWLGTYREKEPGRIFRFAVDRLADGAALPPAQAAAGLAIPSEAQGAAIDPAGSLWVARSSLQWGELVRLDMATGEVKQRFAVAAGIEGIAFDAAGRLWAVSEAGAKHYYDHPFLAAVLPFYPVVFAIDPARLK